MRLSTPFNWLPANAEGDACYNAHQAAAHLRVRLGTVLEWVKKGLLPYFNRFPQNVGVPEYAMPASYIAGFAAFLDGRPASAQLLSDYYTAQRAAHASTDDGEA